MTGPTSTASPLRVLALIAAVFLGTFLASRLVSSVIKGSVSARAWETETTGLGKATQVWKSLPPAKAYQHPKVYVIGSSVSMDVVLAHPQLKTFNFGFFAAGPQLVTWIASELAQEPTSAPRIIALEFLPHFATKRAQETLRGSTFLRKAAFAESSSLARIYQDDFFDALHVLLAWVRGVSAPEINANLLNRVLRTDTREQRGFGQAEDYLLQNQRYDLRDLHPSEEAVQTFIETVQRLKKITPCLVVFSPPENRRTWQRSEVGEKNLRAMRQRIEQTTHQRAHRLPDTYLESDFRDATHLSRSAGQERFNRDLSALIAQECPASLR